LKDPKGVIIGGIAVLQHTSFLEENIQEGKRTILLIILILIGGTIFSVLFITQRWLNLPIYRLMDGIQRMAKGHLNTRIGLERGDEFSRLAQAFNQMASDLQQAQQKIIREAEGKLELERSLRQSEKLATIGQLASELAHEIGTPLNIIGGRAELTLRRIEDPEAIRRNLDIISRQTERITKIIQQLLGFVRKKRVEKRLLNIVQARVAVAACKRAGIKVVMITGDQKTTAEAIARELGLPPGAAVTGLEMEKMSDDEFKARVEEISVFARVEPLHKLRIVEALKEEGYTVAMTGDGVNDGPALRSADIGIAMGIKGTDVAREASDMVLTDDNFASIVAAVEEGRVIFGNIRRSVFYLLSTNVGKLFTWAFAILAGIPLPVVAVQILWINLVTDGVCTIPLGLEPRHSNVLEGPPRRVKAGIVYAGMLLRIAFVAVFMSVGTFFIFRWEMPRVGLEEARTIAFCILVAFQWFNALNARSDQQSLFSLGLFTNPWLLGGIGLAVVLQTVIIYAPIFQGLFYTVPLGWDDWGVVILVAGSIFVADEIRKAVAPRIFGRGKL
jgi:phosphoserine phosphatase/HAMP domain-containing protein